MNDEDKDNRPFGDTELGIALGIASIALGTALALAIVLHVLEYFFT